MQNRQAETLTQSMIDSLPRHLAPRKAGRKIRMGCPFHQSDNRRSLELDSDTQRFYCHNCQTWGYTEQAKEVYKAKNANNHTYAKSYTSQHDNFLLSPLPKITKRKEPQPIDSTLKAKLTQYQADLEQGRKYLESRRISFDLAQRMGAGVGVLAGYDKRVIFPHTNLDGDVVSLYGRSLNPNGDKKYRHFHIGQRLKGVFNAQAMKNKDVWICEGVFDCLALLSAGITNSIAIFGLDGINWKWLKIGRVQRIVFCLDNDERGQSKTRELLDTAWNDKGIKAISIDHAYLGGASDISEAWQRGTLNTDALMKCQLEHKRKRHPLTKNRDIPAQPPKGYCSKHWTRFRESVATVIHYHLCELINTGWAELAIFGYPCSPSDKGGLVWSIASVSAEIKDIQVNFVVFKNAHGERFEQSKYIIVDNLLLPY